MIRTKSSIHYLNRIYKPMPGEHDCKLYTRKMAETAIGRAEEELLSEIIPIMEKTSTAFDDLIKVFPAMKNEPLFAEVKELIKKYKND